MMHDGPVRVETGWLGPAASGADGPGQATLPYHVEINCAVDREPSRTMEVDNRNTWQQHNDYQTNNNRNTVMVNHGLIASANESKVNIWDWLLLSELMGHKIYTKGCIHDKNMHLTQQVITVWPQMVYHF